MVGYLPLKMKNLQKVNNLMTNQKRLSLPLLGLSLGHLDLNLRHLDLNLCHLELSLLPLGFLKRTYFLQKKRKKLKILKSKLLLR